MAIGARSGALHLPADHRIHSLASFFGDGRAAVAARGLLLDVEPLPGLVVLRPSAAGKLQHCADDGGVRADFIRHQVGGGALVDRLERSLGPAGPRHVRRPQAGLLVAGCPQPDHRL